MATKTAHIYRDDDSESPREWDNLGTMACWNRRYMLGDEQPTETPHEYRRGKHIAVELPVYMIDHSGIALSTRDYGDPWDSGQVGIIYVTRDAIVREYGACNAETKALAADVLRGEVATYSQYLAGDVWGYTLEEDGKIVDSCWGFYGSDPHTNGMLDYVGDDWRDLLCASQP